MCKLNFLLALVLTSTPMMAHAENEKTGTCDFFEFKNGKHEWITRIDVTDKFIPIFNRPQLRVDVTCKDDVITACSTKIINSQSKITQHLYFAGFMRAQLSFDYIRKIKNNSGFRYSLDCTSNTGESALAALREYLPEVLRQAQGGGASRNCAIASPSSSQIEACNRITDELNQTLCLATIALNCAP